MSNSFNTGEFQIAAPKNPFNQEELNILKFALAQYMLEAAKSKYSTELETCSGILLKLNTLRKGY